MKKFYETIIVIGNFIKHFLLLAMRIYWGKSLMLTGWGKLNHIAAISEYFSSLGVPLPTFNAYLVGSVELVCGFCLLVGLASRLAAIPLIFTLTGALLTAHWDAVVNAWNDPQNLITQLPFNYLLTALIILAVGPGKISLDYLIQKFFIQKNKLLDKE